MTNTGYNCSSCGIPVNTVTTYTGTGLCHNCEPTKTNKTNLKSCPFCGGEAQYNQLLTSTKEKQHVMVWHEIECVKCGANIHDGADFETAVKEWNVRHNPAVDKKAMAEWELILKLTADEGNAVEIVHDNPDEGYNCLIIFTSLLQSPVDIGYNAKTYTGDTKLQCLQKAWNDYAGEQRLLK